ncbi:MAG: carboxypeptidase-like regulatory domain-containing protein [Planctomycetes bacterium]|jgi:hypothetical protein|nr:carboxypeptidase-like regulatory domain-containing protein [Planctomycetota bacterium]
MASTRPLLVSFVLLAALGAGLWFVFGGEQTPPPQPTAPQAAGAKAAAAEPAPAAVGELSRNGSDGTAERQAVDLPGGAANGGPERAIVGRVVDDGGLPVVGAQVVAWLGGFDGGFGGGGNEWRDRFAGMGDGAGGPLERGPQDWAEQLRRSQEQRVEATSAADGSFRLVLRGAARSQPLRVRALGHRVLDRNVAVPRDASGDIDAGTLQLERGAVIRGRVLGVAGAPVVGARVAPLAGGAGGRGNPFAGMQNGDFEFPGADALAGLAGDDALTDAEGRFELGHAIPGELSLRARHPDHPSGRREGLQVAAGAVLENVVITLEAGATITGRVLDVPAGITGLRVLAGAITAPAPARAEPNPMGGGAEFFGGMMSDFAEMAGDSGMVGERNVEVAADGSFTLRGLRPGRGYRVWAVQQGRSMVELAVCSQRLELTPPVADLELRYDAGLRVTFVVQDARTGRPIETMWIEDRLRGGTGGIEAMMAMAPRPARSRTFADGRVELLGLRPKAKQTLTIGVSALGYTKVTRADLVVPERGELDLGVLQLEPAPVLRVLVTTIDGSTPVRDANVRVRAPQARGGNPFEQMMGGRGDDGGGLSARTGDDGRCVLNVPLDSEARITVEHREFATFRSEVKVVQGAADLELPVALLRGGKVAVVVVDAAGKPVAQARVERAAAVGGRDTRTTAADGTATFERLAPGEHRFRLAVGRGGGRDFAAMAERFGGGGGADGELPSGPEWQSVVVADEATARVELKQAPAAALRGFVRDQGQPVAGARVSFVNGDGSDDRGGDMGQMMAEFGGGNRGRSVRSGDDGSFELKNLPAGNHRLRVTVSGRAMPAVVPIGLGFGDNVVDVVLEQTRVRGVVRGPDGSPLAGAAIAVSVVRPPAAGGEDPMTSAIEGMMPGGLEALGGGGGGRSVKSGDDGTFELVGVQAGVPLRVRASSKGLAAAGSESFQLAPNEAREGLVLQLGAAGKIDVTAGGAGGGIVSARARRLDASGQPEAATAAVMQVLRRGRGTLDGLQPGRWRVELVQLPPTGAAAESREVEVVAGQTAAIVF